MQINNDQMEEFLAMFYDKKAFPHQRLGQAFINHFNVGQDQELFYADVHKALAIIYERYIDHHASVQKNHPAW